MTTWQEAYEQYNEHVELRAQVKKLENEYYAAKAKDKARCKELKKTNKNASLRWKDLT